MPGDKGPPTPDELSEAEAHVWDSVVQNMRDGWFTQAIASLLKAYAAESVAADVLAARLRELPYGKEYREIARMHRAASQTLLSLAVKMRITPSSNRRSNRTRRSPSGQTVGSPRQR